MGAEKLSLRVVLSQLFGKSDLHFPETAAVLGGREAEKEGRERFYEHPISNMKSSFCFKQ